MNNKQVERINNINKLIELISNTDRKFFRYKDSVSKFIESKTTVKYFDKYTGKTFFIKEYGEQNNFSDGGTLLALIRDFKYYIIHGKKANGKYGYGGLYSTCWGYSINGVDNIVKFAKEIGYIDNNMPTYKEFLINLYKNDSCFINDYLKKEIEKELLRGGINENWNEKTITKEKLES